MFRTVYKWSDNRVVLELEVNEEGVYELTTNDGGVEVTARVPREALQEICSAITGELG